MKLRILFTLALFIVSGFALTVNGQEVKTVVQRTSSHLSFNYAYKLTDQDFVNTPSWNPDENEPPISINRALKIAREKLPNYVEKAELWKTRIIMLQSFGEDKWYYRIQFSCMGLGCREIENRGFAAIVKMDGTMVEPKKVTIEK